MNGVHLVTQEKKTSQNGSKMGRVHRVHCPRPAQASRPRAPRAPSACLPRAQRPAARLRLRPAAARPRGRACARQRPCACRPARPSTLALRATPAHAHLPRAPGTPSTHARPTPAARSPPSHARPAPASAQLHNTTYCSMISNLLHQIFFFFFHY